MKNKGKRTHFVGVGGVGMSGLAQMASWDGSVVSGSDRAFDRGLAAPLRAGLEKESIKIFPQDGSGLKEAEEVVASTAVEPDVVDIRETRKRGIKLLSRREFLNRLTQGKKTLAVAGTNGKSTTTALLSWILEKNNFDPSLVLGAYRKRRRRGLGNARRGRSEWFCFEADESDGGLEHYHPHLGIVNNITPDHFSLDDLQKVFARFTRSCRHTLIKNADCPRSVKLPSTRGARVLTFSVHSASNFRALAIGLEKNRCYFHLLEEKFELPLTGLHNVYNALAAIAAASSLNIPLIRAAASLKDFPGLERRMEIVFSSPNLTVIDDYAHNAAKIKAALEAAHLKGKRVIAVYQPHGFAPLRRFLTELADAFSRGLLPSDVLVLLPVYYAGGTVEADIGSDVLKSLIKSRARIEPFSTRRELLSYLKNGARAGDVVLVMGARDPSLSDFARRIGEALKNNDETPACRAGG